MIIMDGVVVVLVITVLAIRLVVIIAIVGVIVVDQPSAVTAGGVVMVLTVVAEGVHILVYGIVLLVLYKADKLHKQPLTAHTKLFAELLTGQVVILSICVNAACAFLREEIIEKRVYNIVFHKRTEYKSTAPRP